MVKKKFKKVSSKNERKKPKDIANITRKMIIILVGVLIILALSIFILEYSRQNNIPEEKLIRMQITCCPCSSGGEEKCVPESEVANYEKQLSECPEDIICAEFYNCKELEC